jgi:hypothetical protein
MASSDHFRDKTVEDRPQASLWLIQPFGLAERWVAKMGWILLPSFSCQ